MGEVVDRKWFCGAFDMHSRIRQFIDFSRCMRLYFDRERTSGPAREREREGEGDRRPVCCLITMGNNEHFLRLSDVAAQHYQVFIDFILNTYYCGCRSSSSSSSRCGCCSSKHWRSCGEMWPMDEGGVWADRAGEWNCANRACSCQSEITANKISKPK